jgi:two-component system chemotaxis response regulator CheB
MARPRKYEAVVIGTSAGGLQAITAIIGDLPASFRLPIVIVQHRSKDQRELLEEVLQQKCQLRVKQADEKENLLPGTAYIAPPDYHLLLELDKTFSLSTDPPVLFSRPAIDVLFESAAIAYGKRVAGILLTGASSDGTKGLLAIRKSGGYTVAQDPAEAQFPLMPKSAIMGGAAQKILTLRGINECLKKIGNV